MQLKSLNSIQFLRLSALLDQAIEMLPGAREGWLVEIERADPESADLLRRLLSSNNGPADGWLETGELVRQQLPSPAEPEMTGRRFGSYRVVSLLGHGGMGSVWLAERADGLFTRQIALKLIHPALVGQAVAERFAREREILAALDHPNIARLLDAGTGDDAQPYLAMEYVKGTPITTHCDECRLSIRERLAIFLQVLSAVEYAHAHLVIHRDLKPSNILVTDEGHVQLLDFGIAKLLNTEAGKETELTQVSGRALTPEYAAPEQLAGMPVTTAADVYSLGVIFNELLTGRRPYRPNNNTRRALEDAILRADAIAPSQQVPTEAMAEARGTSVRNLTRALKGDLDAVALKALRGSLSERYATVHAFAEDISRLLRGDVVAAQRVGFLYRARKFARRNRIPIAVATVVLLTLVAGLAATTYEARVASAQRDQTLAAHSRLLTQAAATRLRDSDVPGAMRVILELLVPRNKKRSLTPEALRVFQEARASDAQVLALIGHTNWVRSAAFSPDGRRIVTTSEDRTARIWDAGSGQELIRLNGHTDRVGGAAFSPDGRRLVTASADRTVRVWNTVTGQELLVLRGHSDRVRSAAFSADGQRIVTASSDQTARVWDATTGRELLRLLGHSDRLTSAGFSPDGSRIVTGSWDKTARIWDAANGRPLTLLRGHSDLVTDAGFAPDGRHVITASYDKTARIWNVTDGRQVMQLTGHAGEVWSAVFSPDGAQVVTTSDDKTARIWDAATGRQIGLLRGHTDLVEAAKFSPDGRRVVTASNDKTARIWDIVPKQQLMVLSGHTDRVQTAGFSPDGHLVLTASNDKTSRIWDVATGRQQKALNGHPDWVSSAAFSPDGRRVVTASYDRVARVWDEAAGQVVAEMRGHTDMLGSAAFSPDGTRVVTASDDKTARVWDAATGRLLMILRGHTGRVWSAAFSGDGQRIVTASADKTARIWDAVTGRESVLLSGHGDLVSSAIFSPDGTQVLTASADRTARIWDATLGGELRRFDGHNEGVVTAGFSADGQRIVTASEDHTARIWSTTDALQLAALLGHTDRVQSAAFSPNGSRVVTASDDATARIWDARVPALDVQIDWTEAAQFDPLSSTERFQLGLPPSDDVRRWPTSSRSKCDESAAAYYDPDRRASGALLEEIVSDIAIGSCAPESNDSARGSRSLYQHGRGLVAGGKFAEAERDFESALAGGYRAAAVDLAMLFSQPSAKALNIPRAISLYERAWTAGVPVAAFELGYLHEHGIPRTAAENEYLLAPDIEQAWTWYRRGADAGEPSALARIAEREDAAAFAEQQPEKRAAHLLEAFKYYAAASQRARIEDWPDEAWRKWRYRRASLARLLARQNKMEQVASTYEEVLRQYAPRSQNLLNRLTELF